MELDAGLKFIEPDDATGAKVAVVAEAVGLDADNITALKEEHTVAQEAGGVMPSRDTLHCSYTRVKITASSNDSGCWSATSVRSGLPNPVM
jgi:hypothetical protein